jgi:hypothetical protein
MFSGITCQGASALVVCGETAGREQGPALVCAAGRRAPASSPAPPALTTQPPSAPKHCRATLLDHKVLPVGLSALLVAVMGRRGATPCGASPAAALLLLAALPALLITRAEAAGCLQSSLSQPSRFGASYQSGTLATSFTVKAKNEITTVNRNYCFKIATAAAVNCSSPCCNSGSRLSSITLSAALACVSDGKKALKQAAWTLGGAKLVSRVVPTANAVKLTMPKKQAWDADQQLCVTMTGESLLHIEWFGLNCSFA